VTRRLLVAALLAAGVVLGDCRRAAAQAEGAGDRTAVQVSAGALVAQPAPLLDVSVGRFVGDRVELGVRQEVGFATGAGAHDWHLATMPFVDVLLPDVPDADLTPFVGLGGGVLYDDRHASGTVGPEAGLLLRLPGGLLLSARYQFRWAAQRIGGVGTDDHLALLGVGFLLGAEDEELARAEASAERAEQAAERAEEAVGRLEEAVGRLERAVDEYGRWFEQQLRK
jgi:hypothetical protein